MKKLLLIICCIPVLSIFGGCASSDTENTIVFEETVEEVPEPTSVRILFDGKEIAFPLNLAIFHAPNSIQEYTGDTDTLYLDPMGEKRETGVLRAGQLSLPVTETSQADSVMRVYSDASKLHGYDVAFSDTYLSEPFYYQHSLVTAEGDITYANFTFIPKGTNKIYSVILECNKEGIPACDEEDYRLIMNSMQLYVADNIMSDYFSSLQMTYLREAAKSLRADKEAITIPPLADEESVIIEPDIDYYLELETGLYSFNSLEGEGELYIEDSRFGKRYSLIGYDSANAPTELRNITLVHGGIIRTEKGVKCRVTK